MRLWRFWLALCCALLPVPAIAVPAPPSPIEVHDGDGTSHLLRMFGDERLAWFETLDGYAAAYDMQRKVWAWAEPDGAGRLRPGPQRLKGSDPRALRLQPHLRPAPAQFERARSLAHAAPRRASLAPRKGTVPNLVLLVRFKDQTPTFSPADFEPVFNGATGSVRAYYREISYGQLDLVSTITRWIDLPREAAYYAVNAYRYGQPQKMVEHAVAALEASGFDFTRFDSDHDGAIDAIDVIHSGPSFEGTGNPDYIHSHYGSMPSPVRTRDGVRIASYHTEPEIAPKSSLITPIGTICHETAHFFEVPDLYDYGYDSAGLGSWCLMAHGSWAGPGDDGTVPTHPSAWARQLLGFLSPRRIETDTAIRLEPVEVGGDSVTLAIGLPPQEYFILENRQRSGFDAYLPGSGLLIFHVDESMWDNDDQEHRLVDLEQADGERHLNLYGANSGDESDPYPLPNKTEFSPVTEPNSLGYWQRSGAIHVTSIRRDGEAINLEVSFRVPAALGAPCSAGPLCSTGYCANGVCCNRACNPNACEGCSRAAGAVEDGLFEPISGSPCDDGNPCTLDDICVAGHCSSGRPKVCSPMDGCHTEGVCDPITGRCSSPRSPDGSPCDDHSACTRDDVCKSGSCRGTLAVHCDAPPECRLAGTCQAESGVCFFPPAPDGTECSSGKCSAGSCERQQRCGCQSASAGDLGPLAALLAGLVALRRRAAPSR